MSDVADSPVDAGDDRGSDVVVEDEERVDKNHNVSDNDDDDDLESLLSEVDEAQFDDFDPAAVDLGDRAAIPIDETGLKAVGVHKRKRPAAGENADDEADEARKRKKKEGRREKPKRARKRRDGSEPFSGGEQVAAGVKRVRKPRAERGSDDDGDMVSRAPRRVEVDESLLTPEERRKRELDRKMDAVLKGPNQRRKKQAGIDLDALADEEIARMRERMAKAAEADTDARAKGQPASHKLTMLPDVVSLLNRNTLRHQIVDPDINLLESVRFFLEPLNDASLPAYNIQKELFNSLAKLPINKETLIASGIGKVVLFYTRSVKAEPGVKRMAERLVTRWTTLLKRNDDYRRGAMAQEGGQLDENGGAALLPSRPRIQGAGVYSIAPQNNLPAAGLLPRAATTDSAFLKRMRMKQMGKRGR